MNKQPTLEHRGVRFAQGVWARLQKIASRDKSKRIRPSDLVRQAVDEYLERCE